MCAANLTVHDIRQASDWHALKAGQRARTLHSMWSDATPVVYSGQTAAMAWTSGISQGHAGDMLVSQE